VNRIRNGQRTRISENRGSFFGLGNRFVTILVFGSLTPVQQ